MDKRLRQKKNSWVSNVKRIQGVSHFDALRSYNRIRPFDVKPETGSMLEAFTNLNIAANELGLHVLEAIEPVLKPVLEMLNGVIKQPKAKAS